VRTSIWIQKLVEGKFVSLARTPHIQSLCVVQYTTSKRIELKSLLSEKETIWTPKGKPIFPVRGNRTVTDLLHAESDRISKDLPTTAPNYENAIQANYYSELRYLITSIRKKRVPRAIHTFLNQPRHHANTGLFVVEARYAPGNPDQYTLVKINSNLSAHPNLVEHLVGDCVRNSKFPSFASPWDVRRVRIYEVPDFKEYPRKLERTYDVEKTLSLSLK
jgi:hypothetical protein